MSSSRESPSQPNWTPSHPADIDFVFPFRRLSEPGPSVAYGGSYASSKPTTPAGITGSCASGGGSGSGSGVSGGGAASSATSPAASSEAAGSSSASVEVPPVPTAPVESASAPTTSPTTSAASGRPGRPGRPQGTEGAYTHTKWNNHIVTDSATASATVDASAGGEVEPSSTVVAEGAEATPAVTEATPSSVSIDDTSSSYSVIIADIRSRLMR